MLVGIALMLDVEELKRRMDALRTLRGLTQAELAELVHQDGHGKHDVGRLERGAIRLTPSLRRSLASHLRVSEQWFTEPNLDKVVAEEDVPAGLDQRLGRMEEALEYLTHWQEGEVLQRILEYRTEAYGRVLERLEQIDRRLAAMGPTEERLSTLEDQMETVLDIAIGRVGADLGAAAAAQRREAREGGTGAPGKGRPGPRRGAEGR